MGRMFKLLTDLPPAARPRSTPAALGVVEPEADDDVPFIEVGGPGGPVGTVFTAKPVPVVAAPALAPAPLPAAPPRLTVAPAPPPAAGYLSVTFHDLRPAVSTAAAADTGLTPDLVVVHAPDHPVCDEYRTLRDEVRAQFADQPGPRALLFTAAAPQSGTSTVVLNLAASLALESKARVLVVDANVGRPASGPRLGVKAAPGLAEVLAEAVPLTWALQPTPVAGLQVLAAGDAAGLSPAAVGDRLPVLVEQLRKWFDWVLVDAGVWGELPERDAACPTADAVYLVTRAADVERTEFAGLRGWVKELGGLLRGYVTTSAAV